MTRRPLIAGNWKMNCVKADGLNLARGILDKLHDAPVSAEVLVCPPATLIDAIAQIAEGTLLQIGGQDCHPDHNGAHTGDIAAPMLKNLGAGYVIVGHSERRLDHGESDAMVRAKAEAANAAGLTAIICVGETEAERNADQTLVVVERQIRDSVPPSATPENTVIAYEPVWAIGTGRTPTVVEAAQVHKAARSAVGRKLGTATAAELRILYGGSVKPSNARAFLAADDIDGALVGNASLNVNDFWAIVESSPAHS